MLPLVIEEQRLGAALAFIVAGPRPDGIDLAAVGLRLRMHFWIAVDLAGRRLEDLHTQPLGQAEHVDGADHAGLRRLDGIVLVVDRRRRTGEIVDLVNFYVERK